MRVVPDSSVRRLLTDVGAQLPYDEMRVQESDCGENFVLHWHPGGCTAGLASSYSLEVAER